MPHTAVTNIREWLGRVAERPMHALARVPGASAVLARRCPVCGHRTLRGPPWPLSQELIDAWELDPGWRRMFERREGLACLHCDACSRYQHFATVLLDAFGARPAGHKSLYHFAGSDDFGRLEVAEINRCGVLHQYLRRHRRLHFSDFGSTDPGVPSEDLQQLSYADGQFDLVVTTDTLEHVPELPRALDEIERVLKPRGRHIFTIPTVWDGRKTRQRAVCEGGKVMHLLPPCYHGTWDDKKTDRLVFHEFGNDVLDYLRTANTCTVVKRSPVNPALSVFITTKRATGTADRTDKINGS